MTDSHPKDAIPTAPAPSRRLAPGICWAAALMVIAAVGVARAQDNGADRYQVVMEKNIFRKLGWAPPNETPRYTVILIAIAEEPDPEPEPAAAAEYDFWAGILGPPAEATPVADVEPVEPRKNRALISRNGSGDTFYVEAGDKVQDLTVVSIEAGNVKLSGEDGAETELAMGEGGFGGGGGGGPRGGGGRRGGGPGGRAQGGRGGGPGGGRFGGQMPAQAREMMERFRNASPEDRQRMRSEFRGGRGGRGR
jgi:hypothetical protein